MKKTILSLAAIASVFSFGLTTNQVSAAPLPDSQPTKIEPFDTMYSNISMRVGESRIIAGDIVTISVASPTDCIGLNLYGKLTAFKEGRGTVVAEWKSGLRVVYYVSVTP